MRRIRLLLEYDGTDFSGWQVQPDARTVQGALQEALSRMMCEPVRVIGSGRTDAGVHALGQVAHADVPRRIPPGNIMMGLNSTLPRDIRVLMCSEAPEGFHAQRSASGKLYRYCLLNRPAPTAIDRNRAWHIPRPLDTRAMREGGAVLAGEHDFFSFKSAGDDTTTVRNLRALQIERRGDRVFLEFEANGFLKHMVRNITGALVQVGLGRMSVQELADLLERRSRDDAPAKAPSRGLTLVRVFYGAGDQEAEDGTCFP